uniref:F-box domain-containing protein n=1 Tax=Scophthalmus maximus TaxID=52904 RepID=A0A8D2ZFK2_SCOMX
MKMMEPQQTTNKQRPSRENCTTSGLHVSNQRHRSNISDSGPNQTLASATCLIKESASRWDNVIRGKSTLFGAASTLKRDSTNMIHEAAKAQAKGETVVEAMAEVERDTSDARCLEENEGEISKEHESSSAPAVFSNDETSHSEPEETPRQMGKIEIPSFSHHLKIPSDLTVYEQYQLCVAHVHHLRLRRSQRIQPGGFTASPSKGRETSEGAAAPVEAPALPASFPKLNSSSTNPETKTHFNEARSKEFTAAAITEGRSSDDSNMNQDRSTYIRCGSALPEHGETKYCDSLILEKNRLLCQNNTVHRTAGAKTSIHEDIHTRVQSLRAAPAVPSVEENASVVPNAGPKYHQSDVKGQEKTAGIRCLQKLNETSSMSLSSIRNGGILPRPQSAGASKHTKRPIAQTGTKRRTPEDSVRETCLQPKDTHTRHRDDTRPTSPVSRATVRVNNADSLYSPAAVPVCDRWLSLPDEVWLSILSLLPHSYLCRVSQVCSRLHTLATDHTLWKHLRIENSTLTEGWLLLGGRRRPRSLCLYSCSGLSVTSCGLEMFFTLCRNYLQEVKVTNCTGPGLHGDQVLPLIGQLCDHVTSVDMSWSGATDRGVKALSKGCAGLRLKSIVLNGCHVTDDPLKKLVMRHKESLCRLELFGCQFLTPSCLQTIYQMCHGLKHLNIGQVPKVNTQSLTVMASQLKSLISLNLTGLQAVTDATVGSLLQNCVKLQSLSLSSCPRVTDLTLHNISKYTPCIRSVDVSGCKAVTDAGVQSMTLGCRSLQQLDLSSTGTGNRGVTLLANCCSGHLQTVKLSFCDISSENILELCKCSKRLKVLHLYGCAHLPTEGEIRDVNTTVEVYPLP